jgi:hypothetical protein
MRQHDALAEEQQTLKRSQHQQPAFEALEAWRSAVVLSCHRPSIPPFWGGDATNLGCRRKMIA